jgi:heterodisulfide reductase subunit A-like polyferredoxin
MTYTLEDGSQITDEFDMAVLSVGLETSSGAVALSEKVGIELDAHRFAKAESFHPVSSFWDGIYVSVSFQAPHGHPEIRDPGLYRRRKSRAGAWRLSKRKERSPKPKRIRMN